MKRVFQVALVALGAASLASTAWAVPCTEIGDAGGLPGTAQDCSQIATTTITGAISTDFDADMYLLYLTGGQTFSATTVGTPGTLSDTQLFLFDSSGMGVYANDDTVAFRAELPAFHPLTPLTAGLYYLVISDYNTDPVSVGGLIFPSSPFGNVYGPTGPGGGSPISGYSNQFASTGTYTIELTGTAAVPEPTTLLLLGGGLAGLALRRRRSS